MKSLLFVVDTNFQLFYSYILNEVLKNSYDTYLVGMYRNEEETKFASKIQTFKRHVILERTKSSIREYFNNRNILSDAKQLVNEIKPSGLVVFKDNGHLSYTCIEEAYKIGCKVVMIEEGLSLYIGSEQKVTGLYRLIKQTVKTILGMPNPRLYLAGENPKIGLLAAKLPEALQTAKTTGKEVVKLPRLHISDKISEEFIQLTMNQSIERRCDKKTVLYIGAPLSEQKVMNETDEKVVLMELFKRLSNENYRIIVKPHPRDNPEKYLQIPYIEEKLVLDKAIPVEVFPLVFDIDFIITPFSSSASNISMGFGIDGAYIYKLFSYDLTNVRTYFNNQKSNQYDKMTIISSIDSIIAQIEKCTFEKKEKTKSDEFDLFCELINKYIGGSYTN